MIAFYGPSLVLVILTRFELDIALAMKSLYVLYAVSAVINPISGYF
jgi:hypothetical protein